MGSGSSLADRRTFRDKTDNDDILNELASIAGELEKDMTTLQYAGKTITVKYKVRESLIIANFSFTPMSTKLEQRLSRNMCRPRPRYCLLLKNYCGRSSHCGSDYSESGCLP